MDDINKKRLEKGLPLLTRGILTPDDADRLMAEAVKAIGGTGRSYAAKGKNAVARYSEQWFLPFGKDYTYKNIRVLTKLIGYRLMCVERPEWDTVLMYFTHDGDRGGAPLRLEIQGGLFVDLARSLPCQGPGALGLCPQAKWLGTPLVGLSACTQGGLRLFWGAGKDPMDLGWDTPYAGGDLVRVAYAAYITE